MNLVRIDHKLSNYNIQMDFPAFLERKTGGLLPEHVKLQGMVTQLYVAMDKRGRLYGEVCIF